MSDWYAIASAPKDRKIDLWAKIWIARSDKFEAERFPDCRWDVGDSMCNRRPSWSGLPKEWHPTHWMEKPNGPPDGVPER